MFFFLIFALVCRVRRRIWSKWRRSTCAKSSRRKEKNKNYPSRTPSWVRRSICIFEIYCVTTLYNYTQPISCSERVFSFSIVPVWKTCGSERCVAYIYGMVGVHPMYTDALIANSSQTNCPARTYLWNLYTRVRVRVHSWSRFSADCSVG